MTRGVLLDLAGVNHGGKTAIPGEVDAVAQLRSCGSPVWPTHSKQCHALCWFVYAIIAVQYEHYNNLNMLVAAQSYKDRHWETTVKVA